MAMRIGLDGDPRAGIDLAAIQSTMSGLTRQAVPMKENFPEKSSYRKEKASTTEVEEA